MNKKSRIIELEAQIKFLHKFIEKIQEINPNAIAPSKEEIAYMRLETSKEIKSKYNINIFWE